MMFDDEPERGGFGANTTAHIATIAVVVVLALGLYVLAERITARNEAGRKSSDAMRAPTPRAPPAAAIRPAPPPEGPPRSPSRRVDPSPVATRTTIYLCKSFDGYSFWSNSACSAQRATIDRMTTVPSELPFTQQVAIARGQAQEAAALYSVPAPGSPAAIGPSAVDMRDDIECAAVLQQIRDLDALALRPQSPQVHDRIRVERMRAMSRKAQLNC